MFESVPLAPPDSILGITEAFNKDPNPNKINLSVGVYKDDQGKTPVLPSVKEAEKRILASESTKNYLPIDGPPAYAATIQALMLGSGHEAVQSKRAVTAQTPSGTASLRVAADYLKKLFPKTTIWMTDPTWPNHPQIFEAVGLPTKTFPYFDKSTNSLAFDAMIAALQQLNPGDTVLLHGCCHNPTGIDPTPAQWQKIADTIYAKNAIPFLDFAYQGFGDGLSEDAACLNALVRPQAELIVCTSYSKNFGLYNERVGALTLFAQNNQVATAVQSQVKAVIRANYSNPPSHGGSIVTTILNDAALRAQWESELAQMRNRILSMRTVFVDTLKNLGVSQDFSFIARQRGMFSFSGLTKDQVEALKQKYSIYIVGNGRINVAGMTPSNMPILCAAIKSVL